MSTDKEDLDIDDDSPAAEEFVSDNTAQAAKTNLIKRRTIDNLLEERRLQRQLADYDFDL
ncbi:PA3496 family putative envelope integrity protein [Pseudomonas putida]|uniref:Leucyl-tRNA synthetase n=1 Tax=Pseudomonas putida TaxID=303 RepID=A0A1Q9RBF0_PSEPU|nr:hypothetical protein [Pseudomonas putida]OLS64764.1 hypothetical protein PSEMO_01870 [Pseudomonas putida]